MNSFYVAYFDNPRIQRLIDIISYICEPSVRHEAHLTVQGPFKSDIKKNKICESTISVEINGIGNFFSSNQNTVFLKCESKALKKIWKKTTYKDFNPHITIYDGESREFAEKLYSTLSNRKIFYSLKITELQAMRSKKQLDLMLSMNVENEFMDAVLGRRYSYENMKSLHISERVSLAEKVYGFLIETTNNIYNLKKYDEISFSIRNFKFGLDKTIKSSHLIKNK